MRSAIMVCALAVLAAPALASETSEAIAAAAYDGRLVAERENFATACEAGDAEMCFGAGLGQLTYTFETLSQAMYRHGAIVPGDTPAALIFGLGMGLDEEPMPVNPDVQPLTYETFRTILEDTVVSLDTARGYFEAAADGGDYVILLDPLRIRLDINGDGTADEGETFGPFFVDMLFLDEPKLTDKQRSKGITSLPESGIGFDRADALWFAGYTQVSAAPIDWMLAHDFSQLFNAYFHQIFPRADLPMQDFSSGRTLFIDPESDIGIADFIAAIHTMRFPVIDSERLAGVLERLKAVPALSRRNWEAILAETDDNRELVPSPSQTSLVKSQDVTEEVVAAWMETLDVTDRILDGELLIPHWRFEQGFNLRTYFETATETDLVMLLTGQGALPFLTDGPIASQADFAAGNRVFGDDWPNFILWFN